MIDNAADRWAPGAGLLAAPFYLTLIIVLGGGCDLLSLAIDLGIAATGVLASPFTSRWN